MPTGEGALRRLHDDVRLEYRVHAAPDAVLGVLRNRVGREARWPALVGDRTDQPIVGTVRADSFRIRRRQRVFKSYAHYTFGRIRATSTGDQSIVSARTAMHPLVACGVMAQILFAAVLVVVALIVGIFSPAPGAAPFTALAVIPAGVAALLLVAVRASRARDEPPLRDWLQRELGRAGPVEVVITHRQ